MTGYIGNGTEKAQERARKMNHWHHGIIKHKNKSGDYYLLHEIYRDDDKVSWSNSGIMIHGTTLADLKELLQTIVNDVDKHGVALTVNEDNEIVPE